MTKDQLNTGLTGQLRYTIAERNLYATLFAVKNPIAHVVGYFVSILRERIANFDAPPMAVVTDSVVPGGSSVEPAVVQGISINDLRKNLRELNEQMDRECASSAARYGIRLDAALITSIDPPPEVESALAAINTAHNQVSSDISVAQASADHAHRAVEAGGADRDAQGAGGGRAAQLARCAIIRPAQERPGCPASLPAQHPTRPLFAKASHIILEMKK